MRPDRLPAMRARRPDARRMSAGAAFHILPVVMPARQAIHAVGPMVPGVDLWGCLASCPFVGAREDAIAHAVSRQFDLVAR